MSLDRALIPQVFFGANESASFLWHALQVEKWQPITWGGYFVAVELLV